MITGKTLIDLGYAPAKWFGDVVRAVNAMGDLSSEEIRAAVEKLVPRHRDKLALHGRGEAPYTVAIEPQDADERDNLASVIAHMDALMRTPTIVAGAVMPDACPSSPELGTIPVGGIVAAKNAIHPGMHSSDICCSMAASIFSDGDGVALLDAG